MQNPHTQAPHRFDLSFHQRPHRNRLGPRTLGRFDHHCTDSLARAPAVGRERVEQPHPQAVSGFQGITLGTRNWAAAEQKNEKETASRRWPSPVPPVRSSKEPLGFTLPSYFFRFTCDYASHTFSRIVTCSNEQSRDLYVSRSR